MATLAQLVELNEGFDYYYEALLWEDQFQSDQYVGLPVYYGTKEYEPTRTDQPPHTLCGESEI